ncbi:cob(I)yrinic acid a,c-diamide adenosyltransferase [Nitrospirillum pindoramense]|uniref:Corrinoid adenosyltransferase n=1 Tax=Nitrospirillum amazonense TaxID=28077 RepID=A0A560HAP0_9PROT|nr:cob(I)yrinic acid a,c-diamide adenosyltransferase [Nitrospirillum amazonense]TWB43413.1 cob(I)alamin adenosyltransferase [Nitrospirillum amazonense]
MTETPEQPLSDEDAARHREKMVKRKAVQDARVAQATQEKGLLMVHTGPGKGKTTAALGMMLRTAGYGLRVGFIQFVKGNWATGEQAALARFADLIDHHVMGEGFTWDTQDKARDIAAASRAWDLGRRMLADPQYHLVVLDEINIVLRYGYLDVAEVLAGLNARLPDTHVLLTGRNAKPEIIEAADLVTEFQAVKHPFQAGIKAQRGIDF